MKIKKFIVKNAVLIGIILSILFISLAAYFYPGGNLSDSNAEGYSLTENYISHLLDYTAINGKENAARPWGIIGVVIIGITTGFAFARFSKKVEARKFAVVIKALSFALIAVTTLITIPALHDGTVTLGSILTLLLFFYVTILFLKSKMHFFKFISTLFLICYYGAAYMYFTRTGLDYLPTVQKIIHIMQIVFILGLEYFTREENFRTTK